MSFLTRIPATLGLLVLNISLFVWLWLKVGGMVEPLWSYTLLQSGALYNPLTLGGEWYRILTHMFLHGNMIHLIFNMAVLISIGYTIEVRVGTFKFLAIYFVSGLAGALLSMYLNLFVVGVGASGAIFGLLGFAFVHDMYTWRKEGRSPFPIIATLLFTAVINVLFSVELKVDNAAHIGGVATGMVIGLISWIAGQSFQSLMPTAIVLPILLAMAITLPRYQVTYFNFYQQILHTEDSIRRVFNSNIGSDEEFLAAFKKANQGWDSARQMLDAHIYLPEKLHEDTMKLRSYIKLKKLHAAYRIHMIEHESYIWLDSMEAAENALDEVRSLQYVLNINYTPPDTTQQEEPEPPGELTKIFYDSNWIELPYPPGVFHRIGYRDSLRRWQGPLRDFYGNGDVQMKGTYKNDNRNGIFIYYSDHHTYESAGQYNNDRRVGKWESFHPNGKMESEVYYADRYFLKSYWDSTGIKMVTDGHGIQELRYPNGVVASHGEYVDGYQHGYWYGKHANGQMYFEEEYFKGRLIRGRARTLRGQTVTYDESSFFALPVGGFKLLNSYLKNEAAKFNTDVHGTVKISFRVTVSQQFADIRIERSLTPELDEEAKRILRNGPRWLPARLHGLEATDGYGEISIEF